MYDTEKLAAMMCEKSGNVKQFCRENGLKYTTIRSSMESSEKLAKIPITNAFIIAHGLGMTVDKLFETLEVVE